MGSSFTLTSAVVKGRGVYKRTRDLLARNLLAYYNRLLLDDRYKEVSLYVYGYTS
jgi:hypothetical protein